VVAPRAAHSGGGQRTAGQGTGDAARLSSRVIARITRLSLSYLQSTTSGKKGTRQDGSLLPLSADERAETAQTPPMLQRFCTSTHGLCVCVCAGCGGGFVLVFLLVCVNIVVLEFRTHLLA